MVGRTTLADLSEIVIDRHHTAGLARFWAAVLTDYEIRREVERLAEMGATLKATNFVCGRNQRHER